MTEFTVDGLLIETQDLSSINPQSEDDGRMFNHDGSSELSTVGGGSISERGFYVWDDSASAWSPPYENADKLDGMESGDFVHRDGSLAMQGDLDLDNNGLINLSTLSGGTGVINLNTNAVKVESNTAGANIQLLDANGEILINAKEGGVVNIPTGSLYEKGNQVATRDWTNANADVPNADYADNAGAVDGEDASAFLHVSGDQMEGELDVGGFNINDSGATKYDGTAGVFVQSALGGPASSLNTYPLSAGDLAEDYAATSRFPLPAGDLVEDYVLTSRLPLPAGDLAEDYALTSRFPIPNSDLSNSSVTVNSGNQLTGGGSVSLGGTITIDFDDSVSVSNADYADSAGDADTLDGEHASAFADATHSHNDSDLSFSQVPLSIPVTKWSDGLTDTEVFRIELEAGESLEVHRLEIQPKGGGDVTDLNVDVFDESTGTVLASTTDVASGQPIGSSSDGANCIVRLTNNSGTYQNAAVGGRLHIV